VSKLRACHLVSKQDPSVVVHDDGTVKSNAAAAAVDSNQDPTLADVAQKAQAEANGSTARDFFHWQPKNLTQEHMVDKKNPEAQSKLFHHSTDHAAQMMWDSKKKLQPSAWFGRQHVRGSKRTVAAILQEHSARVHCVRCQREGGTKQASEAAP